MRALATGDLQVSPKNIHEFVKFGEWLLSVGLKQKIDCLILMGDLKHNFNPVDLRVIITLLQLIDKFKKQGIEVLALEGNHDLLAVRGKQSWFSILKRCGVRTISKPTTLVYPGTRLFCAPFANDKDETRDAMRRFSKTATKDDVLLFHDEIAGCRYNVMTGYDGKGLHLKETYAKRYFLALAGHIHLPQEFGNLLYIGSPVAHDWGECNQRKSIVFFDTNKRIYKRIPTGMPGLYDPNLPNFNESRPKVWAGHTVSLKAHIKAGQTLQQAIDETRKHGEEFYKGATLVVTPAKVVSVTQNYEATKTLIEDWVAGNVPAHLKPRAGQITAFLQHHLGKLQFANRPKIHLQQVTGHNVLSFDKVQFQLDQPGMTFVAGLNKQWGKKRSNGSGKTNALQLIAVLLFGRTLKGQQHDAWVKRGSKGRAFITGDLTVGKHKVRIERGRKPVSLRFLVDGKSHGIGTAKNTQQAIEDFMGFNWETFVSSLYVDRQTTSVFVDGNDNQRQKILAKFIGLDQFAETIVRIKTYRNRFSLMSQIEEAALLRNRTFLSNTKDLLEQLPDVKDSITVEDLKKLEEELALAIQTTSETNNVMVAARKRVLVRKDERDAAYRLQNRAEAAFEEAIVAARKVWALEVGVSCTRCGQLVSEEHAVKERAAATAIKREKGITLKATTAKFVELDDLLALSEKKYDLVVKQEQEARKNLARLRQVIAEHLKTIEWAKKNEKVRADLEAKITALKKDLKLSKETLAYYADEIMFMDFCLKAVNKDGLRKHILQQIGPALDAAVALYADHFTEGLMRPRFEVVRDDLRFTVDNPQGGLKLDDQSRGERCLISAIASLALRDVFSPFDLVIFDEPGDGLDDENAQQFAAGLTKLASRFTSILITSHNRVLVEHLNPARTVTIVKEKGTSTIV